MTPRTAAVNLTLFTTAAQTAESAADQLRSAASTLVAGATFHHADIAHYELVESIAALCVAMGREPQEYLPQLTAAVETRIKALATPTTTPTEEPA